MTNRSHTSSGALVSSDVCVTEVKIVCVHSYDISTAVFGAVIYRLVLACWSAEINLKLHDRFINLENGKPIIANH